MLSVMPQSKRIVAELNLNLLFSWQDRFATGLISGAKLSRFTVERRNVDLVYLK